jgi:hypothetical protein
VSLAERFWDLLGSWSGTEEQAASPWAPAARTRAALTFKLDLAGTAVLQDYRQVRVDGEEFRERQRAEVTGGRGGSSPLTTELRERQRAELTGGRGGSSPLTTEFLAHGVLLADEDDADVVLWWLFDSVGHAPEPGRGAWAGPVLELTRTTPRGSARHRFELGADRLAYAIDLTLTGQEPTPFLRGRYERVSGH